jgi:hypothetical protein
MPSEDVRSATHALVHIIGLVAAMFVLGIVMGSSAGGAAAVVKRISTLFFPFQNTDPAIEPLYAWLLTGVHWLVMAVVIGGMVRPVPRLRMTLATLLAMLASGVVIELVLDLAGYSNAAAPAF